jgi:Cof subfamily protein (haloacid dehalogenase superfamily)
MTTWGPPRLVATDLDGTLLHSDGTVSPRTRAVIARVEAAGVPFVLATGRPPRWMAQVVEQTGHRGIALCANGALVYDLHTERVVEARLITQEDALEVVHALRRAVPGVAFAVESAEARFGHEPAYRPRWDMDDKDVLPVEELTARGIAKLLVRHEEMTGAELHQAASEALGPLVETTWSSDDGLLEVGVGGVTKATALAGIASQLGVEAEEVVAFGDMPNDIAMLSWAGRGVAVAGAHPDVVAVADEVTASNEDDGVAEVLSRWF